MIETALTYKIWLEHNEHYVKVTNEDTVNKLTIQFINRGEVILETTFNRQEGHELLGAINEIVGRLK